MTINCKGQLIDLSTPKILGILNLTPDSFYDGGKLKDSDSVLKKAAQMLSEGADFLDLGGYSSRPGATDIGVEEEINRVLPVVQLLQKHFPEVVISIDTFRAKVAVACLEEGAAMINDISAGKLDADMLATVAKFQVPYVMMHMKGTPQTMQSLANYDNVTVAVTQYFSERIAAARAVGINDLIIDAGFGFAKTTAHNFQLLKELAHLKQLEVSVLTGISRKSMIYKTLNITAKEALNGTSALHMMALQNGSSILRVHDVKEAKQCVQLWQAYNAQ